MKTPEYKPTQKDEASQAEKTGNYYWIRRHPGLFWEPAYLSDQGTWYCIGRSEENISPPAVIGQRIPHEKQPAPVHQTTVAFNKDSDSEAPSGQHIRHVCNELADFLIAKNKAYGNSALEPVRCFSRADTVEQINVRLDDKISRLMRGDANGEDVEEDLLGYLILKRVFYKQEVLRKEMELKDRRMTLEHEKRQQSE